MAHHCSRSPTFTLGPTSTIIILRGVSWARRARASPDRGHAGQFAGQFAEQFAETHGYSLAYFCDAYAGG